MTTDDGGPAYPCPEDGVAGREPGMTLLDYFAGQAMRLCDDVSVTDAADFAGRCYSVAAAMIAEKRRREKQDHQPPEQAPDV